LYELRLCTAQVGRCLDRASNIACTDTPTSLFVHIYHQLVDGYVVSRTLTSGGQQQSRFPSRPPHAYFNTAFLHPIKSAEEMLLFHYQATK
jgi:hypothetical protein